MSDDPTQTSSQTSSQTSPRSATGDDAPEAPTTSGPSDDQLPGHRGDDGPDPDPVDASEAEGGEVGAG